MANMHRLTAELGLIAGALFVQLREAFADWPDTGCPFRDFDEVRRSARGRVRAGVLRDKLDLPQTLANTGLMGYLRAFRNDGARPCVSASHP